MKHWISFYQISLLIRLLRNSLFSILYEFGFYPPINIFGCLLGSVIYIIPCYVTFKDDIICFVFKKNITHGCFACTPAFQKLLGCFGRLVRRPSQITCNSRIVCPIIKHCLSIINGKSPQFKSLGLYSLCSFICNNLYPQFHFHLSDTVAYFQPNFFIYSSTCRFDFNTMVLSLYFSAISA